MKNQLKLLKTASFFPLFMTQFLGAFNDNLFKNALVILITYYLAERYHFNGQILTTIAAGIFILPFFFFSSLSGQLADKYSKSQLTIIIKCCEIFIMVLAALAFHRENIYLLMSVLFLLGMHSTFFGPIKYALLPELVPNDLLAGNGLIEAGTFIAILTGTILGGILILHQGGPTVISFMLLLVAISGLISSWFIPKTQAVSKEIKINFNVFHETLSLIRYSAESKNILLTILGISWFWLVGATFLAEFPVFVKHDLHAEEKVVTLFLTIFSIGLALGSLLCNKLLKGRVVATYVPLAAIFMTLFMIDIYFAASHYKTAPQDLLTLTQFLSHLSGIRILFDLLGLSIAGGVYSVPLYALLQELSHPNHRARVIASNNVINALFMVLAVIVTVFCLKIGFSVAQVFLLIAIFNTFVAIYICHLLPQALVKSIFEWLLTHLFRVEVKGLENYYAAGERVVLIANHTSFLDALLLATYLPDDLTFAVNTYTAKQWWIKLFLHLAKTYPLDPTNPMALKSLIEYVRDNKKCVIFPEGRITMTGALMKIYEGPGLIANKANANLLPIRIDGAQYSIFSRLRGKVRLRLLPKITLTIFKPVQISVAKELSSRQRREMISRELYDLMRNVIFESSHYQQTLFSALIDSCKVHGFSHLIAEDPARNPISYFKFLMSAFILGKKIRDMTQANENIGILLPNMTSAAITFFGILSYHRVPVMLNYSLGEKALLHAAYTANIKVIYTSKKFIEHLNLQTVIDALKNQGLNIVYLEEMSQKIYFWHKVIGFIKTLFPEWSYRAQNKIIDAKETAVILFTSGSEGSPKGVLLSHENLLANRYQIASSVDLISTDIVFNALPIFHSFGLTGGMLLPLLSGVKVFFYPTPLHYRIIPQMVYDTDATVLFGTDTFLNHYASYAHPYDFYHLRYVFAGAEKLRTDTIKVWSEKLGVRIFEGYGATETAPVLAMNTPMQNKMGTVGRLLPGISYRLETVPGVTEGGLLWVKGPNIMQGYIRDTNPGVLIPLTEGWYNTGDIVSFDTEGYLTIQGRLKRFAKIAGEMVSLSQVEQWLSSLWPEYQHAVINLPDTKKGEKLILVTTYQEASRKMLIADAKKEGIATLLIPSDILMIDKMFLLGTGKIDYTAIKNFALQHHKNETDNEDVNED